jgi:uncharacterized membrane protein (DUF106 family)
MDGRICRVIPRGSGLVILICGVTLFLFFLAGNTRVVGQKELETFREEMRTRVSDAYTVILKDKKLPLALLNDNQKVRCC